MKEIFVDRDFTRVGFIKSLLDAISIPCFIRNEFSHNSMAELPTSLFWSAIWIVNDLDYAAAKAVLEGLLSCGSVAKAEKRCPACSERVPGEFDLCWNCQSELAADA